MAMISTGTTIPTTQPMITLFFCVSPDDLPKLESENVEVEGAVITCPSEVYTLVTVTSLVMKLGEDVDVVVGVDEVELVVSVVEDATVDEVDGVMEVVLDGTIGVDELVAMEVLLLLLLLLLLVLVLLLLLVEVLLLVKVLLRLLLLELVVLALEELVCEDEAATADLVAGVELELVVLEDKSNTSGEEVAASPVEEVVAAAPNVLAMVAADVRDVVPVAASDTDAVETVPATAPLSSTVTPVLAAV
ncbi:hypothetical protein WICPIJ_005241 [Wickerhamomyces pijperi]|uniref:Uncharacterized protein n=1 Tax=Wickerhamomyces pijperi TaxID=599730 RepID=A0A9P8Q6C7_WICPI|nr:hypothetical protein WICPIJ_005241 [Wickerhamomyces pijperi]